ncbi:Stp1/IreP family PP2C-type Ser/Thr phosphatase [Ammoniphilus sp. CFH 90114]|uniref:Stp1/IreP family PP2C-type Ser/Thr phosphatase n=1 Tax=Ammoniphilus sp. CFH 90114 TaxID=2493665 RepID=UPI00100E1046|nr:Stp1/IreP family PP2C-type Ser/Thr phosphatase [Ammoniphilus sp. CFH 90114]RXT15050.1 Stp1/IreP family PP2C-type Ser/Thr phosphatase [Ammoniphilus sp. CFH 90114]
MQAAYKTHIGCVRAFNEDTGAVVIVENGYLVAIVADGMGGHQAGDVASLMAVDIVKMELSDLPKNMGPEEAIDRLDRAILKANDAIYSYSKSHDDCHGMGTTVAACLVNKEWLVVGHIGDSRIYRISGEQITQLTEDHSLVNELLKNGQISKEEAATHPQKNILIRALGTDHDVDVELKALEWEPGDRLLLCSDGLSNKISPQGILDIVKRVNTPEEAVEELVEEALRAGGEDNITAIVVADKDNPPSEGSEVSG